MRYQKIVTLITPGRFLFDVGKTPKKWNNKILNDEHIKVVKYFPDSKYVFDSVDIKGGVVILYRDEDINFGAIKTFTQNECIKQIQEKVQSKMESSLSKLVFSSTSYKYSPLFFDERQELKNRVSAGSTRYLSSSVFDKLSEAFSEIKKTESYVQILGLRNKKREYLWFDKRYLIPPTNFNKFKVFVPSSNGTGAIGEVLSTILVGYPLIGHTETFISLGSFETEVEALNLLKYLKTKFARLMLGTKKVTQGNKTPKTWQNVPNQNFTINSDINWDDSIEAIDKQLCKKYDLTDDEIKFLEKKIKKMI